MCFRLKAEYQSSSTSQERQDSISVEFEANKKMLAEYKSDLVVYQGVITLAVLFEGYLLFLLLTIAISSHPISVPNSDSLLQ
ncbi:MAG: hypothetical protein GY786_00390 [Proteobacteria bacterium]|nr:hypothetical protein [Pseudomonadota bacterium]